MNMSEIIYQLRTKHKLSQEAFASILGVSRQAVQKWEVGSSNPDIEKITTIAKLFNVSIDTLLLGSDYRTNEEMVRICKLMPDFTHMHKWELFSSALDVEYRQEIEEGLDVNPYKSLFDAI